MKGNHRGREAKEAWREAASGPSFGEQLHFNRGPGGGAAGTGHGTVTRRGVIPEWSQSSTTSASEAEAMKRGSSVWEVKL